MTASTRDERALLGVAAVLAVVAGLVDAVYFARVQEVFPANQSGSAVLLGIGIGDASWAELWPPAVGILGFAVGIAIAVLLRRRIESARRPTALIVLEMALLLPLAVVIATVAHPGTSLTGVELGALLTLSAVAMGVQTEIIGRVAGVAIATTYQSGAIARMVESVTDRRAHTTAKPGDRPALTTLGTVLVAYIGGAALGAAFGSWGGSIAVGVGLLAIVAVGRW